VDDHPVVSTAEQGAAIDVEVEVLAPGKRTNQVRVTGRDGTGSTVFASLGATGQHRDGGLAGEFEQCPEVSPPEDAEPWSSPFAGMAATTGIEVPPFPRDTGFASVIDLAGATVVAHPDPGPGRVCVWLRRKDRQPITPAMASYMADMIPMSVAVACGVVAAGTSLDNSIRIGSFEPSEWILLDLRPHLAVGDYGHGTAHVWSRSGRLLATASQTASMFRFDPADAPWAKPQG
jgi:acyl-CoA thioesterase II